MKDLDISKINISIQHKDKVMNVSQTTCYFQIYGRRIHLKWAGYQKLYYLFIERELSFFKLRFRYFYGFIFSSYISEYLILDVCMLGNKIKNKV